MEAVKRKALVVFSGGQDSTTCLGWSLNRYKNTLAITFDYGQRHVEEIQCAKKITHHLKVEHHILDVRFFKELVIAIARQPASLAIWPAI